MIENLTNSALNFKIKFLAQEERKLTRQMVERIAEVDRRIDAARLLARCPEVAAQIQTGAVNLSRLRQKSPRQRLAHPEPLPRW